MTQGDDDNGDVSGAWRGLCLDQLEPRESSRAMAGDDMRDGNLARQKLVPLTPGRASGQRHQRGLAAIEVHVPGDATDVASARISGGLVPGARPGTGEVVVAAGASEPRWDRERHRERRRESSRSGVAGNANLHPVDNGSKRGRDDDRQAGRENTENAEVPGHPDFLAVRGASHKARIVAIAFRASPAPICPRPDQGRP